VDRDNQDPSLNCTLTAYCDGLSITDPNNVFMQRDGTRYLSVLLIPGELTSNYFEVTQRGNLSQVWYDSPTIEQHGACSFIRHFGYETGTEKYPVLTFSMVQGVMKMHGAQWAGHVR